MSEQNVIKGTVTAVFAFLSGILGVLYIPVLLMVLCNVIDYATGLMATTNRKEKLSSYKGMRGIFKKVTMWLLVVIGAVVDQLILYAAGAIGMQPTINFLVAAIVAIWIICNELISILENMVDIGVNIPPFLLPIVKKIQGEAEKAGKITEEEAEEK